MSKDVKRMSPEEAESFTSAIKSCRSSRPYGHDSLSIFHLNNLGLPPARGGTAQREDLSSDKSESTHPSRTVVKSIEVFYGVESVVRGNADSLLN